MKILTITNYYPIPKSPFRGSFVETTVQALKKQGINVEVLHPVPHVPPGAGLLMKRTQDFKNLPLQTTRKGIKVYQPKYWTWPKHLNWGVPDWFQYQAVKRLKLEKPDLIHAHFATPSGLLAARLAKDWDIPFVLTCHGYDVNFWPQSSFINRHRFTKLIGKAHYVLAVSTALANKIKFLTGRQVNILASGLAIDKFKIASSKPTLRKKLKIPSDKKVVLYVGNHFVTKGMKELKAAAQALPNMLFITIGTGPLKEELGSIKNIRCLGAKPNDAIAQYMKAADVFVLPSYSEGMPTVLLEAGASGLPVIATQVGGIPELLGEKEERGTLIPPQDVDALIKALKIKMPSEKKIKALKNHINQNFSDKMIAKKLIIIYKDLLKNTKAGLNNDQTEW